MTNDTTNNDLIDDTYLNWLKRLAAIRAGIACETRTAEEILEQWTQKVQ